MPSVRDIVWEQISDYDVKFVKLWFTDILGFLKSFSIPVEELDKAMEEGIGFDGSSIKGFTRIDESDMVAVPTRIPSPFCPGAPQKVGGADVLRYCQPGRRPRMPATRARC